MNQTQEVWRTRLILHPTIYDKVINGGLSMLILPLNGTYWNDEYAGVEREDAYLKVYFNKYQVCLSALVGNEIGIMPSMKTPLNKVVWYDVVRVHVMHRRYLRGKVAVMCGANGMLDNANLAVGYPSLFNGAYVILINIKKQEK